MKEWSKRMKKIIYAFSGVILIVIILISSKIFIYLRVDKLKEIEGGNYTYIEDEYVRKHLEILFPQGGNIRDSDYEWVYKDINGDGEEELILQEKNLYMEPSGNSLIIDIFTVKNKDVVHVFSDYMDAAYYCQLCDNGLLYYEQYYGRYDYEQYILFRYDEEWNEIFVDGLALYYLLEPDEGEEEYTIYEDLYMKKEQLYFWEFQMKDEKKDYERLTQEEWTNKFYDLFGRECKGEIFKYYLRD